MYYVLSVPKLIYDYYDFIPQEEGLVAFAKVDCDKESKLQLQSQNNWLFSFPFFLLMVFRDSDSISSLYPVWASVKGVIH